MSLGLCFTVSQSYWQSVVLLMRERSHSLILYIYGRTQTQNKRRRTSVHLVGFEPTTPVLEWTETVADWLSTHCDWRYPCLQLGFDHGIPAWCDASQNHSSSRKRHYRNGHLDEKLINYYGRIPDLFVESYSLRQNTACTFWLHVILSHWWLWWFLSYTLTQKMGYNTFL
jgi:hypothetical protein